MKTLVETNNEALDRLKTCPNCDAELKQRNSYSLRCQDCGLDIELETQRSRYFSWGFIAVTFAFIIGYGIALFAF